MSADHLMLLGLISQFPDEDKDKLDAALADINAALDKHADMGVIALTLVALRVQDMHPEKK